MKIIGHKKLTNNKIHNQNPNKFKIAITLPIVFFIALVLYIVHHTYAYITPPALIYIPDQNSTSSLLNELKRQGVPLNLLDYRLLKKYPYPKEGWIRFDQKAKLHRKELIKTLQTKRREKTKRVVMYGGDSIELFSQRTAKQTNLIARDIIRAYRKLSPTQRWWHHGWILSDSLQNHSVCNSILHDICLRKKL